MNVLMVLICHPSEWSGYGTNAARVGSGVMSTDVRLFPRHAALSAELRAHASDGRTTWVCHPEIEGLTPEADVDDAIAAPGLAVVVTYDKATVLRILRRALERTIAIQVWRWPDPTIAAGIGWHRVEVTDDVRLDTSPFWRPLEAEEAAVVLARQRYMGGAHLVNPRHLPPAVAAHPFAHDAVTTRCASCGRPRADHPGAVT